MTENDGCVKFNTDSWHYKAVSFVVYRGRKIYHKTNLCPYMRLVVASMILLPFVWLWRKLPYVIQDNAWIAQVEIIFLFAVMIVSVGIDIGDVDSIFPPFWDLVAYGFIGGNSVGILGGMFLFGLFYLVDYIKERPKKEHRTRGLIKTYIESKHDKISPCEEFVENE